jgi:hypothetical protein
MLEDAQNALLKEMEAVKAAARKDAKRAALDTLRIDFIISIVFIIFVILIFYQFVIRDIIHAEAKAGL